MSRKNNLLISAAVGSVLFGLNLLARKSRNINLDNKVVLITGGARGLGLEIARELIKDGAVLALCSRDSDELQSAKEDLLRMGAKDVLIVPCDVRIKSDVESMIKQVENYYGKIDVLVNNAATLSVGAFEDMKTEDYKESLDSIFWGALHTIHAAFPGMKRRKEGRIINICSIGGKISVPHMLPYSTGKFALSGLSQGLRSELRKYGITVTTVYPGLMRTGSHYNVEFKGKHKAEYRWFSFSDLNPMISESSEVAAIKIVEGIKNGDAEVVFPGNTYTLTKLYNLFPNISSEFMHLFDFFLPLPGGNEAKKGYQIAEAVYLPVLSKIGKEAAIKNNEL